MSVRRESSELFDRVAALAMRLSFTDATHVFAVRRGIQVRRIDAAPDVAQMLYLFAFANNSDERLECSSMCCGLERERIAVLHDTVAPHPTARFGDPFRVGENVRAHLVDLRHRFHPLD
jgi:hypothetical protein